MAQNFPKNRFLMDCKYTWVVTHAGWFISLQIFVNVSNLNINTKISIPQIIGPVKKKKYISILQLNYNFGKKLQAQWKWEYFKSEAHISKYCHAFEYQVW